MGLAGPFPLHVPHTARDRRLLKLDCRKVLYHQVLHYHPHHQCHPQCHCHSMRPRSNVKWLEAGGVQVVPIIVNGSIDQTDYFREVES